MRFITEFELLTNFEIEKYKIPRARGAAEWIGLDIAKAFGYQVKGETTLHGPVSGRHTLEIEAFQMDKWIEFKKRFMDALPDYDSVSRARLINAIAELEQSPHIDVSGIKAK